MQLISIKNYASYETQVVNALSPRINVVLGKNGQGKSNFFKAIYFALTGRIKFNESQYQSSRHKGAGSPSEDLGVEIYFKKVRSTSREGSEESFYKLERAWTKEEELWKIDNNALSKNEYELFVQSLGIPFENPFHIVQQGKITQIAHMDGEELYQLLEDAVGVRIFLKKIEESKANFKDVQADKNQCRVSSNEFEEKLKLFQSKKEKYEYYFLEEQLKKLKYKNRYQHNLAQLKRQIVDLKKQECDYASESEKIRMKANEKEQELEQSKAELQLSQQKINYYQSEEVEDYLPQGNELATQKVKELTSKLKTTTKSKEAKLEELKKKSAEVSKYKHQIQPYKDKYEALSLEIQNQQSMQSGETIEKIKSNCLKEISEYKQHVETIQSQIKKLQRHLEGFKMSSGERESQQVAEIKQSLDDLARLLKENKISTLEKTRQKNSLESELELVKNQKQGIGFKLKKALPLLDFNLTRNLQALKIPGVYGYLIEFLQIDPNLSFAYELSNTSLLCTLIVEDEAACKKVIEVNRSIQGRQVEILSLSFVRRMALEKKVYPKDGEEAYSLLNSEWIKVKENAERPEFNELLSKIIANAFSKYMVVKTYGTGLRISKEYHLNCVTFDREIVYSDGYLCKIGKEVVVEGKLEVYQKYHSKHFKEKELQKQLDATLQRLSALQEEEMQLMNKHRESTSSLQQKEQTVKQLLGQKRTVQRMRGEIASLVEGRIKYEEEIKRKQTLISNLQKKKQGAKVNLVDFKNLQKEYLEMQSKLMKLYKEEFSLEQLLQNLQKEQQDLSQVLDQNLKGKGPSEKVQSGKQILKGLLQRQKILKSEADKCGQELQQLLEELRKTEEWNEEVNSKITILESEELLVSTELGKFGDITVTEEELDERSNSMSMNHSFEEMKKNMKPHHYTIKERLMFSTFQKYLKNYQEVKKKFTLLEEQEERIISLIQKYEADNEDAMGRTFAKFKAQFQRIFTRIAVGGSTDVRLKKAIDKTKGITKFKTSMIILVSFTGEERRWSEYSGGQKSVISIAMLLALQKCSPAPFYILDEIDAFLDKFYVDRIVSLIAEESLYSQYFITSFKKEMIQFNEEYCHYYEVRNEERVSRIRRVSKQVAEEFIDKVATEPS